MPNRVYIHIGLPKTATTTLQVDYFPHVDNQRYIYLGVTQPRGNKSDSLYYDLSKAINNGQDIIAANRKLKIRLRDEKKSLILSEEMFTVSDTSVSWQSKLSYLAMVVDGIDARILLTVREPVSAMFSFYVELYERYQNNQQSFKCLAVSNNDFKIYHYDEILKVLDDNFDKNLIWLHRFEDIIRGDFDKVSEFLDRPSMEASFVGISNHNQKKKTSSGILVPQKIKLQWLSRIYRVVGGDKNILAHVLKMLLKSPLKKIRNINYSSISVQALSEQDRKELREQMYGSMVRMAKRFGHRY